MTGGMLGKKIGMTQLFTDAGKRVSVTIIELPDNRVLQVKNQERDGYDALKLGVYAKKEKHCVKAELGAAKAAGGPCKYVKELRLEAPTTLEMGAAVKMAEEFEGAGKLKVSGVTKGKGFQGPMRRYGFAGMPATHGVKVTHRHHGSTGMKQDPGRVIKGKKMAGHMGDVNVTHKGVKVVKLIPEKNLMLVQGAIPGANGGYVMVMHDKGYVAPKASKKK